MQLECFCRFSLSPRGDGNYFVFYCGGAFDDFLYPREGTETSRFDNLLEWQLIFFIPARGRKHARIISRSIFFVIFFIPARGRKRRALGMGAPGRRFSLSPRGDGNYFLASASSHLSMDFLYPREGTETSEP